MALETEMPVDLVLVRHGESEGNLYDDLLRKGRAISSQSLAIHLQSKLHGRHSSEWRLTDLGRHQAKRAGQLVREMVLSNGVGSFDTCFVSSYARAMETAGFMDLPNAKYQVNVFLREKDSVREWNRSGVELGDRQGDKDSSKVSKFYGDAAGLETPADLLMRCSLFLQHLRRNCCGQRVLVVCHNHIMKAFRIILTDVHPSEVEDTWEEVTPNCCIEWYTRRDADNMVRTHFNRRIVLALKEPKDFGADHFEADYSEEYLKGSSRGHELSSQDLIAACADKPQSLNNADMMKLISSPNCDRTSVLKSTSCPPVTNGDMRDDEKKKQLEKIRARKQTEPFQDEIAREALRYVPEEEARDHRFQDDRNNEQRQVSDEGLLGALRRLCCRFGGSRGPPSNDVPRPPTPMREARPRAESRADALPASLIVTEVKDGVEFEVEKVPNKADTYSV